MNEKLPVARRRGGVWLVACFSALLVPALVTAQTTPPAAKSAKPKPKPMTRDELRACMDQQDRVVSMREQLLKQQTSLDQQRSEVGRMDAELERKKAALDPANADAAKALEDEQAKRNEVADAFNARLPAVRELNANYNQERQGWVERCADKDYDANDEAAIKRERQRAAAKGTSK